MTFAVQRRHTVPIFGGTASSGRGDGNEIARQEQGPRGCCGGHFCSPSGKAEDIAVEIHQLKEEVKQLEPLKARLKQLEAEVAKQKNERKEARGGGS
jgi:hypothetical protein